MANSSYTVYTLPTGGGNAEYAAVHEDHLLPIPDEMSYTEAGAIPEAWLAAYQILHLVGKLTLSLIDRFYVAWLYSIVAFIKILLQCKQKFYCHII